MNFFTLKSTTCLTTGYTQWYSMRTISQPVWCCKNVIGNMNFSIIQHSIDVTFWRAYKISCPMPSISDMLIIKHHWQGKQETNIMHLEYWAVLQASLQIFDFLYKIVIAMLLPISDLWKPVQSELGTRLPSRFTTLRHLLELPANIYIYLGISIMGQKYCLNEKTIFECFLLRLVPE